MILFGSAGNPEDFYQKGYKGSEFMPQYLSDFGLDAYEYQCSRGVRISDEKAALLKQNSEYYKIKMSVHAPYYISLSTDDPQKQKKSIKYITDTAAAAKKIGADRIVVHSGAVMKFERRQALQNVKKSLLLALDALNELHLSEISICLETMGKVNELGNSEEVIELCSMDERLQPTIDFGHLYCRTFGKILTSAQWEIELQKYLDQLGYDRMKFVHSHFSKMEYTIKGGEKRHVTFQEQSCGPDFEELAEALYKLKLEPRIICESAGTQSQDARTMKDIYLQRICR